MAAAERSKTWPSLFFNECLGSPAPAQSFLLTALSDQEAISDVQADISVRIN